jgi:predicted DNA-binding transcriptional regulator AlpA
MKRRLVAPSELPSWGVTLSDRQRKRLEDAGQFPRRVPITERTYGYVEDELDALTEARIAARDQATA